MEKTIIMNGADGSFTGQSYGNGVQVIDENQSFNVELPRYLAAEDMASVGFDYHLISVFGSQSTGKSTLLNHLFGTSFGVMAENDRRQTTKGIWMSKNKNTLGGLEGSPQSMSKNILVMDVEGTDGRERGEDQDFERKSALFALATSEVLIVNIWEHQVGLYQGANMALLKLVFEVNLQLFLKDRESTPRSLLFFVIRDHLGTTPLSNLQNTLMQDLARIWSGLNKPAGLEESKIQDFFDFAFAALPHKILQPEKFVAEIARLGTRFREASASSERQPIRPVADPIFLPEYSRRIPADGLSIYAEQVWEQIVSNKDLDLPTQQELMAQFRCDEIAREVLNAFDESIIVHERQQADALKNGSTIVINGLGNVMRASRVSVLQNFETEASRYHKAVYLRKRTEIESVVDGRLKDLFHNQISAVHKSEIAAFGDSVTLAVKDGQKKRGGYDFAQIVHDEKSKAVQRFQAEARAVLVDGAAFSDYAQELVLFRRELDGIATRLRRDEMRRLSLRVERWIKTRIQESVSVQFNALGSARQALFETQARNLTAGDESRIWDRIWTIFLDTIDEASGRFSARAKAFDASAAEVKLGLWRLRRKSWIMLRSKIDEEMIDGTLLLRLREHFEDKFRYNDAGMPRIWRPTDDIEGQYSKARETTLALVPVIAKFKLSSTNSLPPLPAAIGPRPVHEDQGPLVEGIDNDLQPIGGLDEDDNTAVNGMVGDLDPDDASKTLDDEMTILSEVRQKDVIARFKKSADAVFVEAKRSALGGITQVPLYFYGLLLALGWNEIIAVLRNPIYFLFLIILGAVAYITFTLNLWGPMLQMANAASVQAMEEGKKKLREFLEASEGNRRPVLVESPKGASVGLSRLHNGKSSQESQSRDYDDADDDI